MPSLQLEFKYFRKKISVSAQIHPRDESYAQFLATKSLKWSKLPNIISVGREFSYIGNELFICLFSILMIVIAEIITAVKYENEIISSITTLFMAVYSLLFACIIKFSMKQLVISSLICLIAIIIFTLHVTNVFQMNFKSLLLFLFGTTFWLLIHLIKRILFKINRHEQGPCFTMESSAIILNYIILKCVAYSYSQSYTFLLPFFIALICINTLKIYTMFDYDIGIIIQYFSKRILNTNFELPKRQRQIVSAVLFAHLNENKFVPQYRDIYQSNWRLATTILFFLLQSFGLIYTFCKNLTFQSNYKALLIDLCKLSIILIFLDVSRSLMTFKNKFNKLIFSFCFNFLLYSITFMLILFKQYFQNLVDEQSLFVQPLIWFASLNLYRLLHKKCHKEAYNDKYAIYFILFLAPFTLRQSIIEWDLNASYIDIFLTVIYFIVNYLWSLINFISRSCTFILQIWKSENKKLFFYERLYDLELDQYNILQNSIYLQIIIIKSVSFIFQNNFAANSTLIFQYGTIFFSSLFSQLLQIHTTYFLLKKDYKYNLSFLSLFLILISLTYLILSQTVLNLNSTINHIFCSCIIFCLCCIYVTIFEVERLLYCSLSNLQKASRGLVVYFFNFTVLYPIMFGFGITYFAINIQIISVDVIGLLAFGYLWMLLTVVGVIVHLVINLSEKTKKQLFIKSYIRQEMKKIQMEQNIQIIIAISFRYQIYNQNKKQLFDYLLEEKHIIVKSHPQLQISHDYSLKSVDINELLIVSKEIDFNDIQKKNILKILQTAKNQLQIQKNNFTLKLKQQTTKIKQLNNLQNKHLSQVQRLVQSAQYYFNDPIKMIVFQEQFSYSQKTHQFEQMISTPQKCAENMNRLFNFLSYPIDNIKVDTFQKFVKLLYTESLKTIPFNIFNKYAYGNMTEERFKKFIKDFVGQKYYKQKQMSAISKSFLKNQVFRMLHYNVDQFNYWIKKKHLTFAPEKKNIWLNNQSSDYIKLHKKKQDERQKKIQFFQQLAQKKQKRHSKDVDQKEKNKLTIKNDVANIFEQKKQYKEKAFFSKSTLYSMIANWMEDSHLCYKSKADQFKIQKLQFSISNILEVVTKFIDLITVFSLQTFNIIKSYADSSQIVAKDFISEADYFPLILAVGIAVVLYVILLLYHRQNISSGSLGLDKQLRILDFKSFDFYTIKVLFLLGSAIVNYVILICVNSMVCFQKTLFNFEQIECFSAPHYAYLATSCVILFIYWPLSTIIFPYSLAIDRTLQIQYKAQYSILYLQLKLFINGYNTLLAPFGFATWALGNSLLRSAVCASLFVAIQKKEPCSYQLINILEGKIFLLLSLWNIGGVLCSFMPYYIAMALSGGCMLLYLVWSIYRSIQVYRLYLNSQNQEQDIYTLNKDKQKQFIRKGILNDHHQNTAHHFLQKPQDTPNKQQISSILLNQKKNCQIIQLAKQELSDQNRL